jgi:L-iditol 2-dehydrogenase
MKVARLHGIGDVRLHDEAMPEPGEGEVLLKITAVGICGSDLHWYSEGAIGDAVLKRPLVLGHEFAALIASGPRAGERVAVDPAIACEKCELCLAGHPNLCPHTRFSGHGADDGALREYMAWPERNLFTLPDSIDDVDGAMLEPLGVALYAADQAQLQVGGTASVMGCGPIGLLTIQLLQTAGATVIYAYDPRPHRLKAAAAMGALTRPSLPIPPDAGCGLPPRVAVWIARLRSLATTTRSSSLCRQSNRAARCCLLASLTTTAHRFPPAWRAAKA